MIVRFTFDRQTFKLFKITRHGGELIMTQILVRLFYIHQAYGYNKNIIFCDGSNSGPSSCSWVVCHNILKYFMKYFLNIQVYGNQMKPHKQLGTEAHCYVMIVTPNTLSRNLNRLQKVSWCDVKLSNYKQKISRPCWCY